MAKKEALERETKQRMKEVHAAASLVPSVFITAAPKVKVSVHGCWHSGCALERVVIGVGGCCCVIGFGSGCR